MFSLASCDNREDPYSGYNDAPSITVMKLTDSEATLSIKDSVKLGNEYRLKYFLTDEEKLDIKIEKDFPTDSVYIDKEYIIITSENEGYRNILLRAKDSFGREGTANIQLFCFQNLRPVCKGIVSKTATLSDNEVEINLSESFDLDSRWGGKIIQYEYKIQNNYLARNYLSSIKYIFESKGQKKITVRVQDNDNVWSDPLIMYFNLE